FDLPFVVDPGAIGDRSEKLDGMIGEGLDQPLLEVQREFPTLKFDAPKVLDASELAIEAPVWDKSGDRGARIKIFIRRKNVQVELRPRNVSQRRWIQDHFSSLAAYPLRRADDVFFPDRWKGGTGDLIEVVAR